MITEEFTGSTTKRPMLDKLIANLQYGDTLLVTKLDRLARSTSEGSKLITHILLAFAEYECDLIEELTGLSKATLSRTIRKIKDEKFLSK